MKQLKFIVSNSLNGKLELENNITRFKMDLDLKSEALWKKAAIKEIPDEIETFKKVKTSYKKKDKVTLENLKFRKNLNEIEKSYLDEEVKLIVLDDLSFD